MGTRFPFGLTEMFQQQFVVITAKLSMYPTSRNFILRAGEFGCTETVSQKATPKNLYEVRVQA